MNRVKKIISIVIVSVALFLFILYVFLKINKHEWIRKKHFILITIDALRPDHLGCYGYYRDTSPNIDSLAKTGLRFTQAISQGTLTWISLPSLMTSLYPSTLGIYYEDQILPISFQILPGILKKHGYKTCLITPHNALLHTFKHQNNPSAFDIFDVSYTNDAIHITQKAMAWIAQHKDENFFLWLHYFDTHVPYPVKSIYYKKYLNDGFYNNDYSIPIATLEEGYSDDKIPAPLAENNINNVSYYIAKYDGAIRFVDEQIGILLEKIESLGLSQNTLIIISADHGEGLGEHNHYFSHGGVNEEVIKVPLIMKYGKFLSCGKIISQQVGLIDIMPTILSLAKIKPNFKMEGQSILPVIFGKKDSREYIFSEFCDKAVCIHSIRSNEWKLIHNITKDNYLLYNLKNDPLEHLDLQNKERLIFNDLKVKLKSWTNRPRLKINPQTVDLDESVKNRLRSLGYVD